MMNKCHVDTNECCWFVGKQAANICHWQYKSIDHRRLCNREYHHWKIHRTYRMYSYQDLNMQEHDRALTKDDDDVHRIESTMFVHDEEIV
jgi:hypothetical protein